MEIEELFYYCEDSPTGLRRKTDWVSGKNYKVIRGFRGDVAGSQGGGRCQYWMVKVGNKTLRCHRIVWELCRGKLDKTVQIDHIDGNSLNNRIENLRVVTNKTNSRNQKFRSTNTSGVCGVGLLINKTKSGENRYWKAQWNNLEGKRCAKCFSVALYGEEEAFKLACKYREKVMQELNEAGAGYIPRHGT